MDEGKGYNFDYKLYDECYDFALLDPPKWNEKLRLGLRSRGQYQMQQRQGGASPFALEEWHMDGSPCGGTAVLPYWVNASAVKKALHVAEDTHFSTGDNGVGFTYYGTEVVIR